ncbi:MAG: hypothetical protein ABH824_01200 [Nanoarchaeota archaeon]|nr:hypothetical protein [Nanoarchaeota archaeon]MBU1631660.1 hypothetical protein [Nanoarchaeota archaeon]MBU1875758.1 hypothetical protein [Nanoarchaeota archaeon]
MVSERIWIIINISLGLMILLLLLNLSGIELPTLGKAQYVLDKEDPLCVVNWKNEYNQWNDLDGCCLEARKQLGCHKDELSVNDGGLELSWVCETNSNAVGYWLNNKAYNYCRQQSYW